MTRALLASIPGIGGAAQVMYEDVGSPLRGAGGAHVGRVTSSSSSEIPDLPVSVLVFGGRFPIEEWSRVASYQWTPAGDLPLDLVAGLGPVHQNRCTSYRSATSAGVSCSTKRAVMTSRAFDMAKDQHAAPWLARSHSQRRNTSCSKATLPKCHHADGLRIRTDGDGSA